MADPAPVPASGPVPDRVPAAAAEHRGVSRDDPREDPRDDSGDDLRDDSRDDDPWDDRAQLRWLVPLWLLVAAFALVTVVRSLTVGIPVKDPHHSVLLIRVVISGGLFAVLTALDASLRGGLRGWTPRRTVADLRQRWPRRRLAVAAAALLAYHLVYLCYHNLKSWDVLNRPRDTALLSWDRVLFLGHSPAVLLHDLLGRHVAAYVLLVVYESFSTLVTVGVVAGVVLPRRVRDGCTFATCAAWVWVLGVGSYYLVPSLGPFESAPQDFAGLPHTMIQDTQAHYLAQRAHLLAHPTAADAFAQVSAFASLHVAMTTFLLLMAVRFRRRRTTWAMSVFLAGTVLATVYLGWHFAVDDVAGVLIALVAVRLGTAMTGTAMTGRAGAGASPGAW